MKLIPCKNEIFTCQPLENYYCNGMAFFVLDCLDSSALVRPSRISLTVYRDTNMG